MSVLGGVVVAQIGPGLAAAVCGRLLADTGARVTCIEPDAASTALAQYLDHGKRAVASDPAAADAAIGAAVLLLCEGRPRQLRALPSAPQLLREINPSATIVAISP